MATTKKDISHWLDEGKLDEKKGNSLTHMLVVCDTFDYDDYPVYVSIKEDIKEIFDKYNGPNMQKVMEVYCYSKNLDNQLDEYRAFNF